MDNSIKVIDLFAGAGGFGLGFELSERDFELICSLEKDQWAVDTLNKNKKSESHRIIHQDITSVKSKEEIKNICSFSPAVIIGGPPCQGFSHANSSYDKKDPRNSLFKHFSDWVDAFRPKVFVMENVKGILNRKMSNGKNVIDVIQKTFEKLGYKVNVWNLNAANYGVPQNRERVFIVGSLYELKISPPTPTHYLPKDKGKSKTKKLKKAINVFQAIGDLPILYAKQGTEIAKYSKQPKNNYQRLMRQNSVELYNHVSMSHTKRVVGRYIEIINGTDIDDISEESRVRKRNGNGELSESKFQSNYRHLKPEMISYTIPASFYSNFIHPYQPRNITSREAARLQSFPDDYFFQGKRTQISSKLLKQLGKEDENFLSQYNQIGNAVPPLLAKAIANRIADFLKENT